MADSWAKTKLNDYIQDEIRNRMDKHKIKSKCDCRFEVMSQDDEALYEYEAVKVALAHAVDLPSEIRGGKMKTGNLGWGSGSCQGLIYGEPDPSAKKTNAMMMPLGVKYIRRLLLELAGAPEHIYKSATAFEDVGEFKNAIARVYKHKSSESGKEVEYIKFTKKHFAKVIAQCHHQVRQLVLKKNQAHPIRLFESADMVQAAPDS